jgi:hypothetical protein
MATSGRRLPLRSGPSLHPAPTSIIAGPTLNEESTRVQAIRPPGLAPACGRPDGAGRPWTHASGLAPRRPRAGRRTPRWGQAIKHGPGTTARLTFSVDLQSGSSLNACDLASHVAIGIASSATAAPGKALVGLRADACLLSGDCTSVGAAPAASFGAWPLLAPRRLRACDCSARLVVSPDGALAWCGRRDRRLRAV